MRLRDLFRPREDEPEPATEEEGEKPFDEEAYHRARESAAYKRIADSLHEKLHVPRLATHTNNDYSIFN